MSSRWSRPVDILFVAAAVACAALAAVRFACNISFHAPLQLTTSGAEEEALFSIWSLTHGLPVYTDPLAIPYTASYFNWLFYAFYGSVAGATLRLLHLGDAWLPTVCRLITSLLAVAGAAAFFAALRESGRAGDLSFRTRLALAVIALFNPLCGLWLITTRPDIGAVALELAGLALFFRYLRTRRVAWIVLAALALYAAWSFKQTALSALGGIGLTLFMLRQWRELSLLAALWLGGVLVSLAALGPDYRHGLYLSQVHAGIYLDLALRNFLLASWKMPFIPVALAGILALAWRNKNEPAEWAAMLTVAVALVLEGVSGGKGGAADYYFIPLGVWSVLWLTLAAPRLAPRWRDGALAATLCLMILGAAGVLFGWRGTLDCRDHPDPYEPMARYLATRPGPVYVQSSYGDLSWISPTAPHFVVAYMYQVDRHAGMPFEAGGWEALLARGYFSTVVTAPDAADISAMLADRYRFVRESAGYRYFERK